MVAAAEANPRPRVLDGSRLWSDVVRGQYPQVTLSPKRKVSLTNKSKISISKAFASPFSALTPNAPSFPSTAIIAPTNPLAFTPFKEPLQSKPTNKPLVFNSFTHFAEAERHKRNGWTVVNRRVVQPRKKTPEVRRKRCFRCGDPSHLVVRCKMTGRACGICGLRGHHEGICKAGSRPSTFGVTITRSRSLTEQLREMQHFAWLRIDGPIPDISEVRSMMRSHFTWGLGERWKVRATGSDFLIRFPTLHSKEEACGEGPCHFGDFSGRFVPWSETGGHVQQSQGVFIWLQLKHLPLQCWHVNVIREIVQDLGEYQGTGRNVFTRDNTMDCRVALKVADLGRLPKLIRCSYDMEDGNSQIRFPVELEVVGNIWDPLDPDKGDFDEWMETEGGAHESWGEWIPSTQQALDGSSPEAIRLPAIEDESSAIHTVHGHDKGTPLVTAAQGFASEVPPAEGLTEANILATLKDCGAGVTARQVGGVVFVLEDELWETVRNTVTVTSPQDQGHTVGPLSQPPEGEQADKGKEPAQTQEIPPGFEGTRPRRALGRKSPLPGPIVATKARKLLARKSVFPVHSNMSRMQRATSLKRSSSTSKQGISHSKSLPLNNLHDEEFLEVASSVGVNVNQSVVTSMKLLERKRDQTIV